MPVTLVLAPEYGYVVLVTVGSVVVNMWLSIRVGKARKQYKIKYPLMYSDSNNVFNCIQRAHQNYLEYYPQFLALLLLGSVEHPCIGAAAGAVFLAGRIVYALGYSTGDPEKRLRGGFQYIGLLTLLGTTTKFGLRLAGLI